MESQCDGTTDIGDDVNRKDWKEKVLIKCF